MATVFAVTHVTVAGNVAVVQTLEDPAGTVEIGQSIVLAGLTNTALNGTHTITATPAAELVGVDSEGDPYYDELQPHPHQLQFAIVTSDVGREADSGTATWTPVAAVWSSSALVLEFLGIAVATANDTAYVATCVAAANDWAYRKRHAAGYVDPTAAAPSSDVALATTMYAASLYRQRGSTDTYQTYDGMPAGPVTNFGQILGLLGCNRSQVA